MIGREKYVISENSDGHLQMMFKPEPNKPYKNSLHLSLDDIFLLDIKRKYYLRKSYQCNDKKKETKNTPKKKFNNFESISFVDKIPRSFVKSEQYSEKKYCNKIKNNSNTKKSHKKEINYDRDLNCFYGIASESDSDDDYYCYSDESDTMDYDAYYEHCCDEDRRYRCDPTNCSICSPGYHKYCY
jgi:hypothetical protein